MGGLSTLSALIRRGCDHAFCYYADTANAPYGNKSKARLLEALRMGCEALAERGAQAIVLACNTATLATIGYLRRTFPLPFFGVTPPVSAATEAGGSTLLVATEYTARAYRDTPGMDVLALPSLATLVDRYYPDIEPIEAYCRRRLADLPHYDNVVLGCTHYVLIKDVFQRILSPKRMLDGNDIVAENVGEAHLGAGLGVDVLASGDIDRERYRAAILRLVEP